VSTSIVDFLVSDVYATSDVPLITFLVIGLVGLLLLIMLIAASFGYRQVSDPALSNSMFLSHFHNVITTHISA